MSIDKNILRLDHILRSIEKIEFLTHDLDYETYLDDWVKQDAIIRNAEIIGEAIANIDGWLKDKYPEVAWQPAKSMRNFLIHEYFEVDYDAVWVTLNKDLPILKQQIAAILNELMRG